MFDFDATLPVMALQFILLAVILNAVFYKPLSKVLDERAEYIRQTEGGAKEQLAKTEALVQEYELQLSSARKQSQEIIAQAQAEAQKLARSLSFSRRTSGLSFPSNSRKTPRPRTRSLNPWLITVISKKIELSRQELVPMPKLAPPSMKVVPTSHFRSAERSTKARAARLIWPNVRSLTAEAHFQVRRLITDN